MFCNKFKILITKFKQKKAPYLVKRSIRVGCFLFFTSIGSLVVFFLLS
jgi:hypothetical protein